MKNNNSRPIAVNFIMAVLFTVLIFSFFSAEATDDAKQTTEQISDEVKKAVVNISFLHYLYDQELITAADFYALGEEYLKVDDPLVRMDADYAGERIMKSTSDFESRSKFVFNELSTNLDSYYELCVLYLTYEGDNPHYELTVGGTNESKFALWCIQCWEKVSAEKIAYKTEKAKEWVVAAVPEAIEGSAQTLDNATGNFVSNFFSRITLIIYGIAILVGIAILIGVIFLLKLLLK